MGRGGGGASSNAAALVLGRGVRKRMENESLGEGNRRKTEEEIDLLSRILFTSYSRVRTRGVCIECILSIMYACMCIVCLLIGVCMCMSYTSSYS